MKRLNTLKGFLLGVLSTLLTVSLIGAAFASSGTMPINAEFSNIKLIIDGKTITPKDADGNAVEPFIWNGTTYLPVRAVGEALGKQVSWDGNTNTVYLGNIPSPAASYSRNNPAPLGVTQDITISNYLENYSVSISINSATRGAEAWKLIKAANMFNSPAQSGMEYILVNATMTVTNVGGDKSVSASSYDFDTFSSTNTEYDSVIVVAPEPDFGGSLYTGGSVTGYFVVQVSTADTQPKLVYGRAYDGSGGIWFALYK